MEMEEQVHEVPRVSTKQSVERAYALLKSLKVGKRKLKKSLKSKSAMKTDKESKEERRKKIYRWKKDRYLKKLVLDLCPIIRKLPWQEHLIMEEIRNAMSKHDWVALQHMFTYCGFNTTNFQPIRFTYAFLLFLCSHTSNETYFENFLQTCISHNVIEQGILEKLMTLQTREHYQLILS